MPAVLLQDILDADNVMAVRASFEAVKNNHQRRIAVAVEPVDIDKIAVIKLPAHTPVNKQRFLPHQVRVNRLCVAAAQPLRRDIRFSVQWNRIGFHVRVLFSRLREFNILCMKDGLSR